MEASAGPRWLGGLPSSGVQGDAEGGADKGDKLIPIVGWRTRPDRCTRDEDMPEVFKLVLMGGKSARARN